MAAVREAVGPGIDLLIEGHGRFNVPTGIKIAKELEQFKPMWFEEPTPPDSLEALKAVRDKSPVPISAGERAQSWLSVLLPKTLIKHIYFLVFSRLLIWEKVC